MAAIPEPQFLSSACTPAEWETRCEQAALYRILDHYGMSDLANQVVGARVKDAPDQYLLHQYGMFYEEITASSLVKIDAGGQPVNPDDPKFAPTSPKSATPKMGASGSLLTAMM